MAPSPDDPIILEAIESIRGRSLPSKRVTIARWLRVIRDHHPDGLGFDAAADSRFSDPDHGFGVVYAARALATSVAEAVVRDRKDAKPGRLMLSHRDAAASRRAVVVSSRERLSLLDLTGAGIIRLGIPMDVVRGSNQRYSRLLAAAIHNGPPELDGILYPSRLTGGDCIAVYSTSIAKLRIVEERRFEDMTGELAKIYRAMNVRVRPREKKRRSPD